jgi:inosine-uridine nucleoside N-ribohydrolase
LKKKSKEVNFNTEHKAAKFIVSQVNKYPGEVVILCLGAMTNVATALSLDSSLVSKIKVKTQILFLLFFTLQQ